MRGTVYYVVRGNTALLERGTQSPQLEYLAEPFIVATPEGGARGIPETREYVLRAKIFALLHLSKERGGLDALGPVTIDGAFFDTWWEIIEAGDIERMPGFGEKLESPVPRAIVPVSGSRVVDEWIDRVVDFR
jgi:hypothetical protein